MKVAEVKSIVLSGLFDYGSRIHVDDFADLFDVDVPLATDRNDYSIMTKFNLDLLVPYSQVNDVLLDQGKKLKREGNYYVVPTISATLKYVDYYEDRADRARLKAKKLRRSFWISHPTYTSPRDKSKEAKRHSLELSAMSATKPSI